MHVLCRGEWALPRWGEPPDVRHSGAKHGRRELWELRESRGVVLLWVSVLVGWARVWAARVLLTELGECEALADPSLSVSVNKCSNRATKTEISSYKLLFFDQTPGWLDIFGLCILGVFPRVFNSSLTSVQGFAEFSSYFLCLIF